MLLQMKKKIDVASLCSSTFSLEKSERLKGKRKKIVMF